MSVGMCVDVFFLSFERKTKLASFPSGSQYIWVYLDARELY